MLEPHLCYSKTFDDFRGYLRPIGLPFGKPWVQLNVLKSEANVLRGIHYQKAPYQQTKLFTVTRGCALDVVIDLETKKKWYFELSPGGTLIIPNTCAHGIYAHTDLELVYLVDNAYHPDSEAGFMWNNPSLAIEWPVPYPKLCERDMKW